MVQTYPPHMNRIQAGAVLQPCLSGYALSRRRQQCRNMQLITVFSGKFVKIIILIKKRSYIIADVRAYHTAVIDFEEMKIGQQFMKNIFKGINYPD